MKINVSRRENIRAYHSATHLLHESLRRVLGEHVTQKGSLVEPERLRFDFSHMKPVSSEEINKIETYVNSMVEKKSEVKTRLMTPNEAVENGALALFGEKYGEEVRVLSMGNEENKYFSTELCGGTHVRNTGDIGKFKIISQSSIAAGVRRVEALRDKQLEDYLKNKEKLSGLSAQKDEELINELSEKIIKLGEKPNLDNQDQKGLIKDLSRQLELLSVKSILDDKSKNKIKDAAKKLIKIASKRLQSNSYKIEINHTDYDKFCSTFPYVETEDQLSAIEDIIEDFKKNIPSDRLIVGDVAYGKTEVIIRAMFLAAKSNIQSIVIVPTTLLSRQHYENFAKRFEIFNIKVEEVSRLISQKEKNRIFDEFKKGNIQILVGTHALLSDKLEFKKLGLIIYDEEQRFGTLQKEKLKSIAPQAHVIALSATPIPRTLSMSLSGIRDLSLILTAPFERLAVRSYVTPFDEITIKEAIKREILGRKKWCIFCYSKKKRYSYH